MANIEEIAEFAGIVEEIKKELERKNNPYAKYIYAMSKFLGVEPEKIVHSTPVIRFYLRFKS